MMRRIVGVGQSVFTSRKIASKRKVAYQVIVM